MRPAGTELTAYGFGVLLDFWVSELRETLKKEGIITATDTNATVAAEKVPLPDDTDQEGEASISFEQGCQMA